MLPQNTSIEQVKTALDSCLRDIFKVSLTSITASEKGKNGSVTVNFTDPNGRPNGLTGFGIVNDVLSYDSPTLNALAEAGGYQGSHPVGFTGVGIYMAGKTPIKFSPFINYTVSDMDRRTARDARLQGLTGGFVSTQIHELGNSISGVLTHNVNTFGDPNNRRDKDSGYRLELCVLNKLGGSGK